MYDVNYIILLLHLCIFCVCVDIEVDEIQTHESVESALAEATQTSYVEGRWVSKEDEVMIEYSIVDSMCVLRGNNDYSAYCDWGMYDCVYGSILFSHSF